MESATHQNRLHPTTLRNDMADKKTIQADKYLTGFHFSVSFIGIDSEAKDPDISVPFAEVSGIGNELQTEDVTDANLHYIYRLPKPSKSKNLVLKRALIAAPSAIAQWVKEALDNFNFQPCTVVVSILDDKHEPVVSWNFSKAYPVKLEVSHLDASKSELMIETLELAYLQSKRDTLKKK